MRPAAKPCPRCRGGHTKRNGVRADGRQQYRCHACDHQWSEYHEASDPLVRMLRSQGIDARRHGIFNAVVHFAQGQSMARVEQQTGVKAETLKCYLEYVRRHHLTEWLEHLLKKKARLSSSPLEDLREFWVEFEFTSKPYRARGQDLMRRGARDKTVRQRSGGRTKRRKAQG